MTASGFNLYLPPDASPERRAAHERLRLAVEAEGKAEFLGHAEAHANRIAAENALGRILLAEDKARRPEFYGLPAKPKPAGCCGTCAHLFVKPDKLGRIRPRAGHAYRCLAPLPDLLAILPHSVTQAWGWREPKPAQHMSRGDGEGCPTYEARAKT